MASAPHLILASRLVDQKVFHFPFMSEGNGVGSRLGLTLPNQKAVIWLVAQQLFCFTP